MLNITEHLLYPDLSEIIDGKPDLFHKREMIVHAGKMDIKPHWIVSMDVVRNYAEDFMSVLYIETFVEMQHMIDHIHPNKATLEITVLKPLLDTQNAVRYRAYITRETEEQGDISAISSVNQRYGGTSMAMVRLRFQLVEIGIEPITLLSVGGVFKSNSRLDLLHHLIKNNTDKVLVNGVHPIDAISMDEMNNNDKVDQLLIPHMVSLLALPRYLQHKAGGCYIGGIGSFIQRYQGLLKWFVYPTYDLGRFDKANSKLIIYVVDEGYLSQIENTYTVEGGTVKLIATGYGRNEDAIHGRDVNKKYGIRVVDANKLHDGPFKVVEGSITGKKGNIYKELSHIRKKDGVDQIANPTSHVTSNEASAKEAVLEHSGIRIDLEWKNSEYGLLRPGHKVRIYREAYGQVEISDGVLLGHQTLRSRANSGVSDDPMIEHTNLTCFIKHKKHVRVR